ncbi:hypothetical protein [Salinibacter altiplanensis]|uniref:hypothetical protein n=1 Tax=Salinibacter altiplanensis TaxID=1803181 RepID=UPI0012FFFBA5|nr:hypothetical protein [Salinibacter altiplanensis]
MNDRNVIQNFVNNFRKQIYPYLRSGAGIKCTIYPAVEEGAILEFSVGEHEVNTDKYLDDYSTVNEAIKSIKQSAFGGDMDAFNFEGTNYILEDKRIILIKGSDSEKYWGENAAMNDVKEIIRNAKAES